MELTKATEAVYLEQLIGYSVERLEDTFQRTLQEWDKPSLMPPIAFILRRLEDHRLAAEQAWDLINLIARQFWHPDIGFCPGCPEIDAPTEYALRQIGGYNRIFMARSENWDFIRKGFIEAYQRFREEGGEQVRLSEAEARKALDTIRQLRAAELKALPPTDPPDQGERNVEEIGPRRNRYPMSEAEWDSRIDQLRQQARQLGVNV